MENQNETNLDYKSITEIIYNAVKEDGAQMGVEILNIKSGRKDFRPGKEFVDELMRLYKADYSLYINNLERVQQDYQELSRVKKSLKDLVDTASNLEERQYILAKVGELLLEDNQKP